MKKTCFFIGHRDAPDTIYPALLAEVERHITELGVGEFIVGHYGRFDSLAARAVKESKAWHPEVELTLLLPYHPAKKPVQKPEGFDSLFYPPGMEKVPYRAAIVRANPVRYRSCGLPDCLRLAAGEQCQSTGGVCSEKMQTGY